MHWKKARIVMTTWQDGDYRITENPEEAPENRFRLDSFSDGADPEFFSTLDAAKNSAALRNELSLIRADRDRLREELNLAKQAEAFERGPEREGQGRSRLADESCSDESCSDDVRGIPLSLARTN